MSENEVFEIVDESNRIIGKARRSEFHGNPDLIHRTVHLLIFHPDGRILLQKRSFDKDIQPGKWDSAVGGHLELGETFEQAAFRETNEELGIEIKGSLNFLFDSKIRNDIESENVKVFSYLHSGPFSYCKNEIDQIKFWGRIELEKTLNENPEIFTPNLIFELQKLRENEKS